MSQKERRKLVLTAELNVAESSSSKQVWGKVASIDVQPIPKAEPDEFIDRKGKKM